MKNLPYRQVWACTAEVAQTSVFFMSEPTEYMVWKWPQAALGNHITHYFSYLEGDFCRMYFLRKEFDAQADFLATKMLRDPDWALRWIAKVERWSKDFVRASKRILTSRLNEKTDNQLIALYKACLIPHGKQNGYGASVSWLADAENERVTKGIWDELNQHLKMCGSPRHIADVFSILTTPRQESTITREEKDFLNIAVKIDDNQFARNTFRTSRINHILGKLRVKNSALVRAITAHHRKYCWLNYQYRGPATPVSEYLERWQQLMRSAASPRSMARKMAAERLRLLHTQRVLAGELSLTPRLRKLLYLAQQMVFIKGFRKETIYHGMYGYDPLLREIGKRLGLTIAQLWAMKTSEIVPALLHRKFNVHELNQRQLFALAYIDRHSHNIVSGNRAKKLFQRIHKEKLHLHKTDELSGTPACPGKVRGTVKIINIPEDMGKMHKGDILVAHNTNPNLVPAMKKAAALVSESGGLTCHTAIVARELRTPCIVGVPGADKILKDGDKVMVDATNGVIRKIS